MVSGPGKAKVEGAQGLMEGEGTWALVSTLLL